MWVPPEVKDPVLLHAPTRKSVACFGAVSLSSGKFVRSMCARFDALTFEAFLQKLLRHRLRGKRMVVVRTTPSTTTLCFWRLCSGNTGRC
jgi:hypothetical protein